MKAEIPNFLKSDQLKLELLMCNKKKILEELAQVESEITDIILNKIIEHR